MRRPNRWIGTAVLAATLAGGAACAGDLVEPPAAAHARRDAARAAQLDRQLEVLPGVTAARTVLRTPYLDPLAPAPLAVPPPTATVALRVAPGQADAAQAAASQLMAATLADVAPAQRTLVVAPEPAAAAYAKVGPFAVAPSSRTPLRVTLALTLLLVVALASYVYWRERRR